MQENNNSTDLLVFLWKKRKMIIIITAFAAIAGIVGSLLMKNQYKATATIFSTKTNNVNIIPGQLSNNSVTDFGDEDDAERHIQVLSSSEIRDSIINKYDLMSHYNIDASDEIAKTKLHKKYNQNVSTNRTKFNSIEITVWDHDPEFAANIANDIVRLADSVKNRMIRQRVEQPYFTMIGYYDKITTELDDFTKKLEAYKDSGVVSKYERAELVNNLVEASKNGDKELVAQINKVISANQKYGSSFDMYSNLVDEKVTEVSEFKTIQDQMDRDYKIAIAHSFVQDLAEAPQRKSYPVRSIIVIVCTMFGFFFAIALLLLLERLRTVREAAAKI